MAKVFVGHDWAEAPHDVHIEDDRGERLARARLPEGVDGVARFHELVGPFIEDPTEVVVATETDRGLFVGALVAAGYGVLAVNPLSTSRYRSGTRPRARSPIRATRSSWPSSPAPTPTTIARSPATASSEAVKVLARAHQSLIWTRQRQANQLRSTLREFYPGALAAFDELASADARVVLAIAPTPARGRALSRSKIASALRRGGRQRRIEERATEIQAALRAPQLEAPAMVAEAMGASVGALVGVIGELSTQITRLEVTLADRFEQHRRVRG